MTNHRSNRSFLRAEHISKRFGGVEALRTVDLDVFPGEVIGVVGDTDSGKSTLLGLISGILKPDSGYFYVGGRRVQLSPPHRAAQYGIKMVQQDINAAEHMSGLAYIFGGQKPASKGILRWIGWWNKLHLQELALAEFERLGFDPPPLNCLLNDLTSTQRKMVAFVQATICAPRLLLLDEPINALEAYKLNIFRLIEELREQGSSVLLVTQNLDDIFRLSDRIVLLNAGEKIAERRTSLISEEEIVRLILGSAEERLTPAVWALSNYFEVRRQAEQLDQLNQALARRAVQLQTHADVAQSVTSILDRDELLTQIAQIIQQRFGYYHTGIYLLDAEGSYAVLWSSASQNGVEGPAKTAKTAAGVESLVSWCALNGQSRLANDVSHEPLFRPENALPETRSELALPLRIGKRVLGVLDLQSDRINAFAKDDVLVLQSLADQLAIAIRNAELYETAQAARQQADEANRFKSIFLSNMSHELRTPLTAIIGHTRSMLDPYSTFYGTPLPKDYVHDLHTIRKSGEHLLALINDILDLSRIEAGEFKLNLTVIDLKSILDDAFGTAEVLIQGRPINLCRDYPDTLPPVWADSVRTRQIVLNLLSNAAKFTEQGQVMLKAHKQSECEIVVSVADTGIGIPKHLRQHIFERFRRGDTMASKKWAGTGLGLNISRQLVELQGGHIWVESEIGAGSTFSFTIPLATPEQIALRQADERASFEVKQSVVFEPDEMSSTDAKLKFVLLAYEGLSPPFALQQTLEQSGYAVELSSIDELLIEVVEVIEPDWVILDTSEAPGFNILHKLLDVVQEKHIPLIVLVESEQQMLFEWQNDPARRTPVYILDKSQTTPQQVDQIVGSCFGE